MRPSVVAESFSSRETVSAGVRRHALSPSQLFTWRRQLRKQMDEQGVPLQAASVFVPAIVEAASTVEPLTSRRPNKRRRSKVSAVELEIDGVAVKINRGADAGVIAAVIEALKATR